MGISQTTLQTKRTNETRRDVIGLIPAGGQANRIAPLPCSKELYPIGFQRTGKDESLRPKVVCHYLLEKMRIAGITKTYIVLRKGKWDIPAYFGDGEMLDMYLAYLMMRLPFGVPYTIDQAYPFVQDAIIALGFPDIIFRTDDAFVQLLKRQAETNADIVLGVFITDQPQKWDMVDFDENKQIRQIEIKPLKTHHRHAWAIAIWTPKFTHFMHKYLSSLEELEGEDNGESNILEKRELFVGDVIQAAIDSNLQVDSVLFPHDMCIDIGTPGDLFKAVHDLEV